MEYTRDARENFYGRSEDVEFQNLLQNSLAGLNWVD